MPVAPDGGHSCFGPSTACRLQDGSILKAVGAPYSEPRCVSRWRREQAARKRRQGLVKPVATHCRLSMAHFPPCEAPLGRIASSWAHYLPPAEFWSRSQKLQLQINIVSCQKARNLSLVDKTTEMPQLGGMQAGKNDTLKHAALSNGSLSCRARSFACRAWFSRHPLLPADCMNLLSLLNRLAEIIAVRTGAPYVDRVLESRLCSSFTADHYLSCRGL